MGSLKLVSSCTPFTQPKLHEQINTTPKSGTRKVCTRCVIYIWGRVCKCVKSKCMCKTLCHFMFFFLLLWTLRRSELLPLACQETVELNVPTKCTQTDTPPPCRLLILKINRRRLRQTSAADCVVCVLACVASAQFRCASVHSEHASRSTNYMNINTYLYSSLCVFCVCVPVSVWYACSPSAAARRHREG